MTESLGDDVGIVLLAAGESRRMAGMPETPHATEPPPLSQKSSPKALLPWLGRPLIQYQLEQIAAVTPARIVLVTGYHAGLLAPFFNAAPGIHVVENPDPARGRASSIVHGVSALPETMSGFAIVNVDQPCAAPILTQLIAARAKTNKLIALPRYQGKRGHPPLFAGSLRDAVLQVSEQTQGLKSITRSHCTDTAYVDIDDPGVVWNLNTPEDYRRAQRQHVLLATTNTAKAAHLSWLLEGVPLRRVTLAEANLSHVAPPPETQTTLHAIAESKAVAWSRAFGGLAIASDGGIAIPALGDAWEERLTARFAGSQATDKQRVEALLALLQPYTAEDRRAHFRECVALAHNGTLLQSWSAESAPGLIADSYRPDQLVSGFWLLTLWRDPQTGRRFGGLTPDDPAYSDGAWARIKTKAQPFLKRYAAQDLSPAT